MKNAMTILGVIGALVAIIGSIMTMISGYGSAMIGTLTDAGQNEFNHNATIFWSGVCSIGVSLFALVSSVAGGSAKQKNTVLTFALATLILGAINIYLYNWISGGLILVAGLLGLIGAKEIEQNNATTPWKTPLFIVVSILLLMTLVASVFCRNLDKIHAVADEPLNKIDASAPPADPVETLLPNAQVSSQAPDYGIDEKAPPLDEAISSKAPPLDEEIPSKAPVPDGLPFVGLKYFNFYGGNGTGESINIEADGTTTIQLHGKAGALTTYHGKYKDYIPNSDGEFLNIQDEKIYMFQADGTLKHGCREEQEPCMSGLLN